MLFMSDHYQNLVDEDSYVGMRDNSISDSDYVPDDVRFMAWSLRECGFLPEDLLPLVDQAERLCGVAEEAEVVPFRVQLWKRCDALADKWGTSRTWPSGEWDRADESLRRERASWRGMRALNCMFSSRSNLVECGQYVVEYFIDFMEEGSYFHDPLFVDRMVEIFDECVSGKMSA